MYAVSADADGRMSCSPSSYRREAPIGVTPLNKKQFGVFLQIFNILRKKGEMNLEIGGFG
jgi:hypothetical protein